MVKNIPIDVIQTDDRFQIFPKNSDEVIQAIKEDMEANGYDEASPLVLWGDVIIDGHTRFEIATGLGIEEVPCIRYDFENEDLAFDYAIHIQRDRRNLGDEQLFFAIEKVDQKLGRGENLRTYARDEDGYIVKPSKADIGFTGVGKESRKDTAEKLGIGKTKVQEARTVIDYGDDKIKDEIKSGNKSIHKAYEEVQEKRKEEKERATKEERKESGFTETDDGFFIEKETKNPKAKFNEQDETHIETIVIPSTSIEWAKWSWNPITGCKHGCKYCYARDIANRFFPTGFTPTLYPNRLLAPSKMEIPEDREHESGINNVFVCSMADLFGDWVPQEWIDQVLDAVRNAPEWNFIFLTKNPKRYIGIEWPENAWVGTTVDTQERVEAAVDAFSQIEANVKFLSCEPLKEHLQFNSEEYDIEGEWLSVFNWVIIGGQSGSSGEEADQPEWEWVESLHNQARNAGCAIYWKPNLTVKPKEYPKL